ncbi:MAG: rhomboid family intramembrane serine protease [Micrococcus sp.]|nr:rhomboid family intramembrane serine protease [Micrococcus sp.]
MNSSPHENPAPGPDGAGAQSPECPRHPGRAAYMACRSCRRPTCLECQRFTTTSGHVICVDCAAYGLVDAQGRPVDPSHPAGTGVPGAGPAGPGQSGAVPAGVATGRGVPGRGVPGRRRSRFAGTPAVVWVLIALNTLAFAGQWFTAGRMVPDLTEAGWYAGAYTSQVFFEPWRMLTNAFLHSPTQPAHLLLNMAALWLLGRDMVRPLGTLRFLVLYVLSALGGSVAVLWLSEPTQPVLGASGAVYGLFAALFVAARARGGNVRSLTVLLALNLAISFLIPGISWQGHVGGLVVGALVALAFRPAVVGAGRTPSAAARAGQWGGVALVILALVVLTWLGSQRITAAMIFG